MESKALLQKQCHTANENECCKVFNDEIYFKEMCH